MLARCTLVLAALGLAGCSDGPPPRARHLVLITVDTLRADRLGCYGGPNRPSPFIDEMARRGVLFENAFAQRGMTLPSMTTFFTSKYPIEHGVIDNTRRVPDEEVLLAERLSDEGFATFALNATHVLSPESNIDQGFAKKHYLMFADETEMTFKAVRYIRNRFGEDGRREFLWIHFMNPHKPYFPPVPFDTRFTDPLYQGEVDADPATLDAVFAEGRDLSPEELDHVRDVYDGCVAFVDACVQRIVRALEERGLLEDTLLVFTSDHGEELGDHHRYFWHANSIYAPVTRIPFIALQPGSIPPGRRIGGLLETTDFLPTVLSWLGLPPIEDARHRPRGNDLSAVLAGEIDDTARSFALSFIDLDGKTSEDGREGSVYGLRDLRHAYVFNPDLLEPNFPPKEGRFPIAERELYDVKADPLETRNVVVERPREADRLHRALLDRLRRLDVRHLSSEMSEQRRRALEELGYLSGEGGGQPAKRGP